MHLFASLFLSFALLSNEAVCYSDLGHRTVALLARKYLSKAAVKYYDGILANTEGFEFDDAATWADTVKRARPWTKTWHYIDARDIGEDKSTSPQNCKLEFPSDCDAQKQGCIISALNNQTSIFMNSSASITARKEALMFTMHFFGDLHQPLHIEDAFRGGNEIEACFRKRCSGVNLHSIWDSYIPNKITGMKDGAPNEVERQFATAWAQKLYDLNSKAGISSATECADTANPDKCSVQWARESNKWICKYVLQPNVNWLESNDLSLKYFDGAAPIVEELIGKAGVRLGTWLNSMHSIIKTSTENLPDIKHDEHLFEVKDEM
ncbi:S1/P1 nuclease [Tricladium varicosporioides]|nr:S1/P1 nuclease [Hymenoscyphus varicosporioides]